MSCKELIESLRKTAEERIRLLWQEAESQGTASKTEAGRRLEQLREEIDKTLAAAMEDSNSDAVSDAQKRARMTRLSAEKALSDRLYEMAVSSLSTLRKSGYDAIFVKLAKELPADTWEIIRVNPEDEALARKHFPGSRIVPDEKITGGMEVLAAEGSVRIINTFEKRLERAWSDLLPAMIKDVHGEVSHGTSSAS